MLDYGPWIKESLELAGRTQASLAEAFGIDASQITKLVQGRRRLQLREIAILEAHVGRKLPQGFGEEAAEFEDAPKSAQPMSPIYAVTPNSSGGWLIERHHEPSDHKPRAPHFINSAKVFGFYAPDDAMAPRFKKGEMAWVDPVRPASPGDDVAVISRMKSSEPETIILAELRKLSQEKIVVAQHKDQVERTYDRRRWDALLVLPRY